MPQQMIHHIKILGIQFPGIFPFYKKTSAIGNFPSTNEKSLPMEKLRKIRKYDTLFNDLAKYDKKLRMKISDQ